MKRKILVGTTYVVVVRVAHMRSGGRFQTKKKTGVVGRCSIQKV